ncbi:hypothetical protein WN48_09708 [Eufriesea mexicana]|uniref:Uncharacterized protein n=1 Tax=Eufriesea mexicana TaxID=516756 RepID=A0A310S740_9HYME|nr:hypothetical protein WN48_09708 [Eufriesea mexicana]
MATTRSQASATENEASGLHQRLLDEERQLKKDRKQLDAEREELEREREDPEEERFKTEQLRHEIEALRASSQRATDTTNSLSAAIERTDATNMSINRALDPLRPYDAQSAVEKALQELSTPNAPAPLVECVTVPDLAEHLPLPVLALVPGRDLSKDEDRAAVVDYIRKMPPWRLCAPP